MDGFSARKLRNYYLVNPEETGERHFKLLLSQTDKTTLTAIVSGDEEPEDHSIRVKQNFALFERSDRRLQRRLHDSLQRACKAGRGRYRTQS